MLRDHGIEPTRLPNAKRPGPRRCRQGPVVVDTGTSLATFDDGSGTVRAFTGALTIYGVDAAGSAVPRASITDVQLFEGPLGSLGVWYSLDRLDAGQIKQFLRTVEGLGYDVLWYPEGRGFESLSIAAFALSHSQRLKLGSSIASIYARDAFTARRGVISLNALYDNRFILGLGVSHIPMVEKMRCHTYEKPVPAMRRYLDDTGGAASTAVRHGLIRARHYSWDASARTLIDVYIDVLRRRRPESPGRT